MASDDAFGGRLALLDLPVVDGGNKSLCGDYLGRGCVVEDVKERVVRRGTRGQSRRKEEKSGFAHYPESPEGSASHAARCSTRGRACQEQICTIEGARAMTRVRGSKKTLTGSMSAAWRKRKKRRKGCGVSGSRGCVTGRSMMQYESPTSNILDEPRSDSGFEASRYSLRLPA